MANKLHVELEIAPENFQPLMDALNRLGVDSRATIQTGELTHRAARALSSASVDDDDAVEASTDALRQLQHRVRVDGRVERPEPQPKPRRQTARRVEYVHTKVRTARQTTDMPLTPKQRIVEAYIRANGPTNFADIVRGTKLKPKTVDGSIYALRHTSPVLVKSREL